MSWQNGTSTDYLDMLDQLIELATSDHVDTAAVNSGGTGYTVGDILSVAGGTSTHVSTIEVTSVAGGVIDGVRMNEGGAYTVDPSLTANAVTGGTGSSATLDLTMTDTSVQTVTINAGGTGYAINDVLTVAGGTFTNAATILVTSVAAGVIDGVRVDQSGLYSVDPSLTANAVTGGGGSSATMDLTMGGGWRVERRSQEAVSATIGSGGTGYTVGDDITLTDDGSTIRGDVSGTTGAQAVFNVDSESAGVVTAVSLVTAGNYEEIPANAVATTGGTGGGNCTLNVTWQDSVADSIVILESVGDAGIDEIMVGLKTFTDTDVSTFETVYNWGVFGMTGLNLGLVFHQQPDISPGMTAAGVPSTLGGAFTVLKPDDADPDIEFWVSVRNNQIKCIFKVQDATETNYSSMYLGFHNGFATDAEEPYPIYAAGCTSRNNSWFGDSVVGRISGLTDAFGISARIGPGFVRVNGNWQDIRNSNVVDSGSPTRSQDSDYTVYPVGLPTLTPDSDDTIIASNSLGLQWDDVIPVSGVPGSPLVQLRPTPDAVDDARILVPATIVATDDPGVDIYMPIGELDGVFWVSAAGSTVLTSEDSITIGAIRYRVFQNGTQTAVFSYMAIRED